MNDDDDLERIVTPVPGPWTRELTPLLQRYESRNVTYFGSDFPVFWESAHGANVVDVDGNRYIDLSAAFGVANAGHGNPYVAKAVAGQAMRLMHGMGDVHPTQVRAELLERLASILPAGLTKTFLASTGSEAVEAALKTAVLATGKSRFAAFRGAYHGLSLGALSLLGIDRFRTPFAGITGRPAIALDFPDASGGIRAEDAIARTRRQVEDAGGLAAIVVEPIQGRGGVVVPPRGYLAALRALCDERGALLIVDEIFTGFGRTGAWFAVQDEGVAPDILCIGKAMANGFPIGAAVAREAVMDAWPVSPGEALHTSTYLGNPMACAAALATIGEIARLELPQRARAFGPRLLERLERLRAHACVTGIRGRGMLFAVAFASAAQAEAAVKGALTRGVIVLQTGPLGDAISISPPLTISERQLSRAIDLLEASIAEVRA